MSLKIQSITVRLALGCILALCAIPTTAFAISLPTARDLVVVPGATASVEIPVTNSGITDANYSVLLFSASIYPGTEQPQLGELSSELSSWLSLSSPSITVPSGATVPVTISVRPPTDAPSQSFIIAVAAAKKRDGEISLIHGPATLVFVNVGDVLPLGSCEAFLLGDSGVASLTISNAGRGVLYDDGEIVLRGMFGFRLGIAPSNPLFHRVVPGQTRTWEVSLPPIPWWAIGPVSYSVDDAQLDTHPCVDIDAGVRWFPLFGIGVGVVGVVVLLIRKRAS